MHLFPMDLLLELVFVNAISNLLTTAATNLKLSIGSIQPAIDLTSIYLCNYSTEISNHKVVNSFYISIDRESFS